MFQAIVITALIIALLLFVVGIAVQYVGRAPAPASAPPPAPAPAPTPVDLVAVRTYKPESWCLMSEDYLGRWCSRDVQRCPTHRLYTNREACEMVDASSMPLNIVTGRTPNGGLKALPLARAAIIA